MLILCNERGNRFIPRPSITRSYCLLVWLSRQRNERQNYRNLLEVVVSPHMTRWPHIIAYFVRALPAVVRAASFTTYNSEIWRIKVHLCLLVNKRLFTVTNHPRVVCKKCPSTPAPRANVHTKSASWSGHAGYDRHQQHYTTISHVNNFSFSKHCISLLLSNSDPFSFILS